MYQPRTIEGKASWLDETGVKIYTVSASDQLVEQTKYLPRLKALKLARQVDWISTPSFAIFHDGESCDYLVLAWWANDNELFTSVSVKVDGEWVEDPERYSFCLYDLEIIWAERNIFINTIDCENPSLTRYQDNR